MNYDAHHAAKRLLPRARVVFPADVRPIEFVGIDVDVVAFVQPHVFGRLRVDLNLPVADAGRTFVGAMRIAKIVAPDPVPIDGRPRRVSRMSALGRRAEESIALLPERIDRLLHFVPRHLEVADLPQVGVDRVERNAVVGRPDERAGRDDHVRQIRRGFDAFAMDDQVFAILDRFGQVAVAGEPAAIGVERNRIVNLLPERHARIGAEEHQRRTRLTAIVAGEQLVDVVGTILAARGRGRVVEDSLDVDLVFFSVTNLK